MEADDDVPVVTLEILDAIGRAVNVPPGGILVVRATLEQVETIFHELADVPPEARPKVTIIFLDPDTGIEALDDDDMAEAGWVRKEAAGGTSD